MSCRCALHCQSSFDVSTDFLLTLAPKPPLADAEVGPAHLGTFVMLLVDPNVFVCLQVAFHIPQLLLVSLDFPWVFDLQLQPSHQACQEVNLAGAG